MALEGPARDQFDSFRQELLSRPGIRSVTASSQNPLNVGNSTTDPAWTGKPEDDRTLFYIINTRYDFVETMDMELVAGRTFSRDFASDSANYIINERAAEAMEFANPIGQDLEFWGRKGQIVGVVKDFHMGSLYTPIEPTILRLEPRDAGLLYVRTAAGETPAALASLEGVYEQFNPGYPFEVEFLDADYERMYRSEMMMGTLANLFAGVAIFIACLGLFGLAAYTAERRRTEIGVRKVLGASAASVVALLSREFVVLVIIAFAVATTLIPAVVALRPRTAGTVDPRPEPMALVGRRWRALPFVVLGVGAAALYPALQVRFDADPMALRDPTAPSVAAFRMLSQAPRTSPYRASVLTASAEEAAALAGRFQDVPGIAAAVTIADLVPRDQDAKLMLLDIAAPSIEHALRGAPAELIAADGDVPVIERLQRRLAAMPGAGARLAAALAAYQERRDPASDAALAGDLFRTFPLLLGRLEAMLGADYVTQQTLPEQMRRRYVSPGGIHRVEILPEEDLDDPAALTRFAETVQAIAPEAAGGPMQLAAAGRTVGESMLRATLLAALATGALAWAATRRLVDMAAILLPLVVGGVVTAAASVLLDMPFNYANVIVLPLMLGLGVASGVHIAVRERRAPGAVFATSTPRAVLFSALTTVAAFGTLALSDHRGTASMGVLLSVSVVAAVGAVLGLTPALMRWAARARRPASRPG